MDRAPASAAPQRPGARPSSCPTCRRRRRARTGGDTAGCPRRGSQRQLHLARADRGAKVPAGFYPLYESMIPIDPDEEDDFPPRPRGSGKPDFDAWDAKLAGIDEALEVEERRRLRWWQRDYWRQRSKLWWTGRAFMASFAVLALLIGWLTVTAPLSKSLEPIAPPQVTLLASDGTPIARQGAIVEAPVKVADLPPHVVQAFLAIEDRRFYSHWGVDPRGIARAAWTGCPPNSARSASCSRVCMLVHGTESDV